MIGHAEKSRHTELDSSVFFNMPRPKDDASNRKAAVKSDDSWIGRPEHVQGRGKEAEGDGHDRRGMRVEHDSAVQGEAQEGVGVRRHKSTASSARSSRWDRAEV